MSRPKIMFTQEQITNMINMYSVNYKSVDIVKDYNCSFGTILRVLCSSRAEAPEDILVL